jgi:hypothetical protein
MFEEVIQKSSIKVLENISSKVKNFYLAGGTGMALQLGHRKSDDFDFFSSKLFNSQILLKKIKPDKEILLSEGTLHILINNFRFSFLFFEVPLLFKPVIWHKIKIAHFKDITAEKFRAISMRGAKKDFYDLYAVLKNNLSIEEACFIFKKRFSKENINTYHILKSLVYFDDAEKDPSPTILNKSSEWEWQNVKEFFIKNIRKFEKNLI